MKSGLELEQIQSRFYIFVVLLFFFFTGWFFILLGLCVFILAPLEELDPDEVESEEELWPFLEFTYVETNWLKGKARIGLEFKKEFFDKKELLENFNNKYSSNSCVSEKFVKKNNILVLNELITLKII